MASDQQVRATIFGKSTEFHSKYFNYFTTYKRITNNRNRQGIYTDSDEFQNLLFPFVKSPFFRIRARQVVNNFSILEERPIDAGHLINMRIKMQNSPALERATTRAAAIASIDAALDLGNDLSLASFKTALVQIRGHFDTYNILLSQAHEALATFGLVSEPAKMDPPDALQRACPLRQQQR